MNSSEKDQKDQVDAAKNSGVQSSELQKTSESDAAPAPPAIHECFSCAADDCGLNVERACGYDDCDGSEPRYCRRHFISHLAGTHPKNHNAQDEARKLVADGKYPEGHPCKWHEGDEPTEIEDESVDNYMPPGCSYCGTMLSTKTCDNCAMEFLDWEDRSFDDVIAGPYVTTSGDLACMRCGPRMDHDAEEAESEEYDYPMDYLV